MEIKWQERQADHSLSSSAKFKNCGAKLSLPLPRLHGVTFNELSTGITLSFSILLTLFVHLTE
jgi:hypothetical protein